MNYRDFFLIESWKNYTVSTNPEILLYDFYKRNSNNQLHIERQYTKMSTRRFKLVFYEPMNFLNYFLFMLTLLIEDS